MLQALESHPEVIPQFYSITCRLCPIACSSVASPHIALARSNRSRIAQVVHPVRCGYLWRTSSVFKKWQRRWYSFQNQLLTCAEAPQVGPCMGHYHSRYRPCWTLL